MTIALSGITAWSGCPSYNLSVCFADSSPSRGASGETVHFAGTAKASPTRSCWGRGQQDASGSEADAGSRNPGSVTEGDGEGKDADDQI